jgi:pSer/pThr/pTyr-binding forkhead associated (FHA) protein
MEPPAAALRAQDDGRLLLVCEDGARRWLEPGRRLTLGRTRDCDLFLIDAQISKRHARIVWSRGQDLPYVEDTESTNGVWVDGRRVLGRQTLRPGALLVCGETRLMLLPSWSAVARVSQSA